tara:strand:+ start:354 stop:755 length:402 start_codon:yes stop_codon:yes gene_type:complete
MTSEERIEQLEKQKEILKTSIRNFRENRSLDTMDEVAYRELKIENEKLKKRAEEAEGENTIIKGIGQNSPEMKELRAKVNELNGRIGSAQDINDEHQRYNSKLQIRLTEVEDDNKKLSLQIEDKLNQLRKSGM